MKNSLQKILILGFVFFCAFLKAQTDSSYSEIDEDQFDLLLNSKFTELATGNAFTGLGKFAKISTDNNTLSASINVIERVGMVTSFNFVGGALNGISEIFSNNEINTNISGGLNVHFFSSKPQVIEIDYEEVGLLNTKIKEIKKKFTLDSIGVIHNNILLKMKLDSVSLSQNLKKLSQKNIKIDSIVNLRPKDKRALISKDSIKLEKALMSAKILQNKNELNEFYSSVGDELELDAEIRLNSLRQKRDKDVKGVNSKISKLSIEAFKFSWFTFGFKVTNEEFKLFDSSSALENQIKDEDYISQQINLGYTNYIWDDTAKINFYFSFLATYKKTSNLSQLKKITLTDTRAINESPLRESISTQEVFEGVLKRDINSLLLESDTFIYCGTKELVSLHLNPKIEILDDFKPVTTLKTGLLFPFRKQGDNKSIVNLEFFYQINDVFNTQENEDTLFSRNSVGLQASFPLNL